MSEYDILQEMMFQNAIFCIIMRVLPNLREETEPQHGHLLLSDALGLELRQLDKHETQTVTGTLSDGVTISEANYLHYWEDDKPEEYSSGHQWYFSESYEYVSDPDNRVNIEITWSIDKWER